MPRLDMGIIQFIVIAAIIGIVIWAVNTYTPIPAPIKKIILWAGVFVIVLLLLAATGILGHDIKIPSIR